MRNLFYDFWSVFVHGLGKLSLPFGGLTDEQIQKIVDAAQPLDVLQTCYRWWLLAYIIPGWDHSAVILDKETVIDATGNGVHRRPLRDVLKERVTSARLLRAKKLDCPDVGLAWVCGEEWLDYDYSVNGNDATRFYCHELARDAWHNCGVDVPMGRIARASVLEPYSDVIVEV